MAEELDVRAILTGTLVYRDDTLAVRVELVDGLGNALIWGQRYSRELNDILAVEEDIARCMSSARMRQSGQCGMQVHGKVASIEHTFFTFYAARSEVTPH